MGRFFQNLKTKTIAGSSGPTSTQLQTTGQTIFIDKSNKAELEELILAQKAHYFQTQNGAGLPHPGLSEILTSIIDGIEDYVAPLVPLGQEIYKMSALSLTNDSGVTANYKIGITDGVTNMDLTASTTLNNATTVTWSVFQRAGVPGNILPVNLFESSMYLVVYSDQDLQCDMALQKLSVR